MLCLLSQTLFRIHSVFVPIILIASIAHLFLGENLQDIAYYYASMVVFVFVSFILLICFKILMWWMRGADNFRMTQISLMLYAGGCHSIGVVLVIASYIGVLPQTHMLFQIFIVLLSSVALRLIIGPLCHNVQINYSNHPVPCITVVISHVFLALVTFIASQLLGSDNLTAPTLHLFFLFVFCPMGIDYWIASELDVLKPYTLLTTDVEMNEISDTPMVDAQELNVLELHEMQQRAAEEANRVEDAENEEESEL